MLAPRTPYDRCIAFSLLLAIKRQYVGDLFDGRSTLPKALRNEVTCRIEACLDETSAALGLGTAKGRRQVKRYFGGEKAVPDELWHVLVSFAVARLGQPYVDNIFVGKDFPP